MFQLLMQMTKTRTSIPFIHQVCHLAALQTETMTMAVPVIGTGEDVTRRRRTKRRNLVEEDQDAVGVIPPLLHQVHLPGLHQVLSRLLPER